MKTRPDLETAFDALFTRPIRSVEEVAALLGKPAEEVASIEQAAINKLRSHVLTHTH